MTFILTSTLTGRPTRRPGDPSQNKYGRGDLSFLTHFYIQFGKKSPMVTKQLLNSYNKSVCKELIYTERLLLFKIFGSRIEINVSFVIKPTPLGNLSYLIQVLLLYSHPLGFKKRSRKIHHVLYVYFGDAIVHECCLFLLPFFFS